MDLNQGFIAEIKIEAANTRKILERVPLDKSDFKPHEKSMSLGRLASHIAEMFGWIVTASKQDELDFSKADFKPFIANSTKDLTDLLDKNATEAIAALESMTNEDFGKMWSLRSGAQVYFTMPKAAVIRSFALSHIYHHRGQLSVYLRLCDVPVPGMYGPSKDDSLMMQQATSSAN